MLGKRKPDLVEHRDGRIELRGVLYHKMRQALCEMANTHCEQCGRYTGLLTGHAHHMSGRGGGRRDDRIMVNGERNLQWLCGWCHGRKHVPEKVVPEKPRMSDDDFKELMGL